MLGPVPLPANKFLRLTAHSTFDYPFTYLTSVGPVNLTGYTATWTITPTIGTVVTYTSGGVLGTSGVFFGGNAQTPVNGIIDLVIIATDISAFTWTTGSYTLSLTPSGQSAFTLLTGGIAIL